MKDRKEILLGSLIIKDWWLWGQVKIVQQDCPECGLADDIIITKGKELTKLINILKRLNYKGIPK